MDPDNSPSPPVNADVRSPESELRRRTRRGFVTGLAAAAAGYAGLRWLKSRPEVDGLPGPLRTVLGFNERISQRIFDPSKKIRELPESAVTADGPRTNGAIGLEKEVDLAAWRLDLADANRKLTLTDIKTLPEVTQITPLNCIEGWTTVARWTGVRFSDFTDKFYPAGRQKPFVGLATPEGDYFVGLDAASAFHEQTLLCYAINGEPLSNDHGAPLRLLIPVKYGVKNLKRVGQIRYISERPKDYWAEQGYDWFAGF